MATKEQIEAVRDLLVQHDFDDDAGCTSLACDLIDAALAAPVDPSAYSQEQVERALDACRGKWGSAEGMRAALAAAGVQPIEEWVNRLHRLREAYEAGRASAYGDGPGGDMTTKEQIEAVRDLLVEHETRIAELEERVSANGGDQ